MNWIADLIYLDVAPDGSSVKVTDGVIQYHQGKDVDLQAKIVKNNEKKIVFRWFIDAISTTQKTVRMTYIATLFKDTKKFTVFAKDGAYIEEHTARGSCARV